MQRGPQRHGAVVDRHPTVGQRAHQPFGVAGPLQVERVVDVRGVVTGGHTVGPTGVELGRRAVGGDDGDVARVDGARRVGGRHDGARRVGDAAPAGRDEHVDVVGAHLLDQARLTFPAHAFEIGRERRRGGSARRHSLLPWITGSDARSERSVARNAPVRATSGSVRRGWREEPPIRGESREPPDPLLQADAGPFDAARDTPAGSPTGAVASRMCVGPPKRCTMEGSPPRHCSPERVRGMSRTPESASATQNPEQGRIRRRSSVEGRSLPPGDRTLPLGKAPWLEYETAPNGTMRISSASTWKTSAATSC